MADQTPTRMPGANISAMTTPRMAATRRMASAGFTMPNMRPKAVRMSATIASDPVRAKGVLLAA
jgi:hypothetical protein